MLDEIQCGEMHLGVQELASEKPLSSRVYAAAELGEKKRSRSA